MEEYKRLRRSPKYYIGGVIGLTSTFFYSAILYDYVLPKIPWYTYLLLAILTCYTRAQVVSVRKLYNLSNKYLRGNMESMFFFDWITVTPFWFSLSLFVVSICDMTTPRNV